MTSKSRSARRNRRQRRSSRPIPVPETTIDSLARPIVRSARASAAAWPATLCGTWKTRIGLSSVVTKLDPATIDLDPADRPARDADGNRPVGKITVHERARSDYAFVADLNARSDHRVRADVAPVSDPDGLALGRRDPACERPANRVVGV